MFFRLWERYILRETFKMVLLLLLCCYLVYSIMDFSLRSRSFTEADIPVAELLVYYGWQFLTRLEILLPLAVMLATIKVVTGLNTHGELTALLASGLRLRRLIRSFLFVSLLAAAGVYLCYEFGFPTASHALNRFEDRYFHGGGRSCKSTLSAVRMADDSKLLYRHYDSDRQLFLDTFWVRSSRDIVRIKELSPYQEKPLGRFVDYLQSSNEKGELQRIRSAYEEPLQGMHFDKDDLFAAIVPAVNLSLCDLWKQRPNSQLYLSDREAEILTYFYKKLAMPLLCLLVVVGPIPFCVRFGRRLPLFLICGLSLLGFVTFLMVIDAAEILGEEHVLSPLTAVGLPIALFVLGVQWPFWRILKQ